MQQCPIPPRKSLTYQFKADLYGTSWYHSHYSAQYAGGLFGREYSTKKNFFLDKRATKLKSTKIALIIHGPKNVEYDQDIGPVILTDWYHDEYFEIVKRVMSVPVSEWELRLRNRSCFVLKNEIVAATSAFRQQFD